MRRNVLKSCVFVGASCVLAAASAVHAAVATFTGGGADPNWSTDANWAEGTAPANDGSADVTLAAGATLTNVDASPWNANSLTVAAGTTYTMTGSTLRLGTGNVSVQLGAKFYIDNDVKSFYGNGSVNVTGSAYANGGNGSGTLLGGVGTIEIPVQLSNQDGYPPYSNAAIIAPGDPAINNGIGTLTLNSGLAGSPYGSNYNFTFGATGNSQINDLGSLTLSPGNNINIFDNGGVAPGTYTLINYAGPAIDPANFDPATVGYDKLNLPAGWVGTLESSSANGNGELLLDLTTADVSGAAIPEPASMGLLLAGGLPLMLRRRRAK